MIMVAPSVLSADFAKLGEDCDEMQRAGADILHFDVMDGLFVPNISFGVPVLESLNKYTGMPIDVHLMIDRPSRYIEKFSQAGADYITIHIEAEPDIEATLKKIKAFGAVPSVCIKPATPAKDVFPYLHMVGMVLVMSVEPGFGGQSFMPSALEKIAALKAEIDRRHLSVAIEVDGGINLDTGKSAIEAGAGILVAGNALFKARDKAEFVRTLKGFDK